MKESQSVTNSLLIEVDFLSNRLKNIKKSFKTTNNKEFNFSTLLFEKAKRSLNENKFKSNLFFL